MKIKTTLGKVAALIGILTGIAGIYIPVAQQYYFFPFDSKKEVSKKTPEITVQEAFVDDAAGKYPVLDVTVLNEGNQTSVLTKAHFKVERLWKLNPSSHIAFKNLQPTANYEVTLHLHQDSLYDDFIRISQSIEESEADRFTFTLKHEAPIAIQYVVQLEVAMEYDENKSAQISDLIFVASKPGFASRYASPSQALKTIAKEIKDIEGNKSLAVEKLIAEILGTGN